MKETHSQLINEAFTLKRENQKCPYKPRLRQLPSASANYLR